MPDPTTIPPEAVTEAPSNLKALIGYLGYIVAGGLTYRNLPVLSRIFTVLAEKAPLTTGQIAGDERSLKERVREELKREKRQEAKEQRERDVESAIEEIRGNIAKLYSMHEAATSDLLAATAELKTDHSELLKVVGTGCATCSSGTNVELLATLKGTEKAIDRLAEATERIYA